MLAPVELQLDKMEKKQSREISNSENEILSIVLDSDDESIYVVPSEVIFFEEALTFFFFKKSKKYGKHMMNHSELSCDSPTWA